MAKKIEIKEASLEPVEEQQCDTCGQAEPIGCELCNDNIGTDTMSEEFYCIDGWHVCEHCKKVIEELIKMKITTLAKLVNKFKRY